jgi:hypothetical protein
LGPGSPQPRGASRRDARVTSPNYVQPITARAKFSPSWSPDALPHALGLIALVPADQGIIGASCIAELPSRRRTFKLHSRQRGGVLVGRLGPLFRKQSQTTRASHDNLDPLETRSPQRLVRI